MQPSSSLHSNFFSSLKQVEKRLKLENPTIHTQSSLKTQINNASTSTESNSSAPLYVHTQDQLNNTNTLPQESNSEPPSAFFSSNSPQFPPISVQEHPEAIKEAETDDGVDEIELMMQLLGLLNDDQVNKEKGRFVGDDGGFYDKIVGVIGPKCEKEAERLRAWIDYFNMNGSGYGEERMEPLRLAFLLLGKAAFDCESNTDFALEFPKAIQDFLKHDPHEQE